MNLGPWLILYFVIAVWLAFAKLFALHTACGVSHLTLHMKAGDACFLALLLVLLISLVIRVGKFRKDWPPPQMLLAVTGLLCGIAGAMMWQRRAMRAVLESCSARRCWTAASHSLTRLRLLQPIPRHADPSHHSLP